MRQRELAAAFVVAILEGAVVGAQPAMPHEDRRPDRFRNRLAHKQAPALAPWGLYGDGDGDGDGDRE